MKITEIQVFGERNSGTNYLRKLFNKNYKNIRTLMGSNGFGWKHGDLGKPWIYRKDEETFFYLNIRDYKRESKHTLFVVIYRNPLTWIQSMHQSPHHAPELFGLSLDDFIKKKWRSYYGPGATDLDPDSEKRFSIVNEKNLFEEYENIFDLRNKKINIFEEFKNKVNNVAYLQYETLRENYSDVLADIALAYHLEINPEIENISEDKFGWSQYKKKEYPSVTAKTLESLFEQINWGTEAKAGYRKSGAFYHERRQDGEYSDLEKFVDRTDLIRTYRQ